MFVRDATYECVPAESCDEQDPCSEFGACVDDTGFVMCVCDVGYAGFEFKRGRHAVLGLKAREAWLAE